MRIVITGPAAAFDEQDEEITDAKALAKLDGSEYTEELISTYFDGPLEKIGISGGGLRLVFDKKQRRLLVVADFLSPRKLKPKELKLLQEETEDQWSDGIGGGGVFDQEDVSVDLSPTSDEPLPAVTVEQIDDGTVVKKPRKSPLFNLAKKGDIAKLTKKLDEGESPDTRDKDGFTPLHTAINNEQTEAALLLIDRGADTAVFDILGSCPLTAAAMRGNLVVGKALLALGVEVDQHIPGDGIDAGSAPLIMACNRNQFEFAKLLIEHDADVNWANHSGYTPLLMLDPEDCENEEERNEMVALARLLIEKGADPAAKNGMNRGIKPKLKELLGL